MEDFNADLFTQVADVYDEAVPFFSTFGRALVAWAGVGGLPPAARVLDLGAGRGAVSIAAAEALPHTATIIAGDISPAMVARLTALPIDRIRPRLLDAQSLDLPDGSCDAVFAAFVLHILTEPAAAFAGVARVLTADGALYVAGPGPSDDGGWWAHYGTVFDRFARHVDVPSGMSVGQGNEPDPAAAARLRPRRTGAAQVRLPVAGPQEHWEWLLSHGNRWLHDALDEPRRWQFRSAVLDSLRDAHPTGGQHIIAGATFTEYVHA